MSTFERDNYQWRETYFVMFEARRRPQLNRVRDALRKLGDEFELIDLTAEEEDGSFESVTVLAPADLSAVDVSYLSGEEVTSEAARLAKELGAMLDPATKKRLAACDARFDIMHFEHVTEESSGEPDEAFDPSALLMVLDALTQLTDGIGIDPQSGAVM